MITISNIATKVIHVAWMLICSIFQKKQETYTLIKVSKTAVTDKGTKATKLWF